jgi:glutamate N-acetyltransferase/amino-acid N-acetyltransferase
MPVSLTLAPPLPVSGVRLASVAAGIKSDGSIDLVLMALPEQAISAAVFTQSHFAAAPVQLAQSHLASCSGAIKALLVNSGNANAGTGEAGLAMARGHCAALAKHLGIAVDSVLPFSTGVIGQLLPDSLMLAGIERAANALQEEATLDHWRGAAEGIMTTDTRPKLTSRQCTISGNTVTLTGFAKGAGMIEPNMATMLAYVFTDAAIVQPLLDTMLRRALAKSFNAISVDSDTSTNDSMVLCATHAGPAIETGSADETAFQQALDSLCLDLAQAIIRDAEGATKFVTVTVEQGDSTEECRSVARAIANSPLVKTALFASDANVGRLLAAIGKAEVPQPVNTELTRALDANRIRVLVGEVPAFELGGVAAGYTEEQGAAVFAQEDIDITVQLGRGGATYAMYTSDLSHDYVSINADYRS